MRLYNIYGKLTKKSVGKYRVDWDKKSTPVFQGFRSEAGENMVIEKHIFRYENWVGMTLN